MTILQLILTLIIIGVILWGVAQIPMPNWLKAVIQVIAIIAVIIYVAGFFGVHMNHMRLGV